MLGKMKDGMKKVFGGKEKEEAMRSHKESPDMLPSISSKAGSHSPQGSRSFDGNLPPEERSSGSFAHLGAKKPSDSLSHSHHAAPSSDSRSARMGDPSPPSANRGGSRSPVRAVQKKVVTSGKDQDLDTLKERPWRLGAIYPIIPERLYFTVHRNDSHTEKEAREHPTMIFFSSDFQERYEPFCADFGPTNLGVLHEFCAFLQRKLVEPRLQGKKLVYYTDEDEAIRTNCAFLLAAFLLIKLKYNPVEAWTPFACIHPSPFKTYRDATYCPQDYHLTISQCLEGLQRGLQSGYYVPQKFDLDDYMFHDHPQNADMHMLSPKFCAFRGPSGQRIKLAPGCYTFTPSHYHSIFKSKGVKAVIRLNEPTTYNAKDFEKAGIKHFDLYFDDCTVPNTDIIRRFIDIVDSVDGAVAVHCKAGLGRTGTLIAIYWMMFHQWTASECIGWLRIVRPGSIIGPQQQFLHDYENRLKGKAASNGKKVSAEESAKLAAQVANGMNVKAVQRTTQGDKGLTEKPADKKATGSALQAVRSSRQDKVN